MKRSVSTFSRTPRLPNGGKPKTMSSGRLFLELGCWIGGIALIVTYLAASTGLENHRKQGIELFAQARAAELVNQSLDDHTPGDQTMSGQDRTVAESPTVPEGTGDTSALPIAILRMTSVGLEVPVFSDISELNLSRGAGWIEGTATPNSGGNMAVAAHRDRYFRPLKDIQVGDTLKLESMNGHGEFKVSRIVIVDPDDVSVLDDTPVPTVTLVTCYPFYFIGNAPQRYIVQATAVDQSGKVSTSDALLTALPLGETP